MRHVELAVDFHCLLAVCAVVAEFHARLDAPENVRCEGDVTIGRVLVGHGADMRVHAEDFLDDDDARTFAAFGQREIALEGVAVCRNVDPAGCHGHDEAPG